MRFLRHLLGITKLDKEKNQCIRQNTGGQNTVKGIKQYQEKCLQHVQRMDKNRLPKVATTCTEDGHKQTSKSGYNTYRGWTQIDYQKWLQHVQRMDTNRLPKVATTCTEDGHKQTTKNKHYNINQKDEGT
jgi:hypothetical protein